MTSIQMIIEEVKRLSNLYENKVPSVLLFETLFKAEEVHKQEIEKAYKSGFVDKTIFNKDKSKTYYQETYDN
jgi:hypothetical protein